MRFQMMFSWGSFPKTKNKRVRAIGQMVWSFIDLIVRG